MNKFIFHHSRAVILCGGQSSRMGSAKHRLTLRGKTFLDVIASLLSQRFDDIAVSSGAPPLPRTVLPCIADERPGLGPLGALSTLLKVTERWLFVTPCDVPFLSLAVVDLLAQAAGDSPGAMAVISRAGGRIHPLTGFYRSSCLPFVEQALARKCLSLHRLLQDIPHEIVPIPPEETSALRNINTPEEYRQAIGQGD